MPPTEPAALCVSIHDVSPATWPECLHLLHAVRAVADIPLSWLVVPRYHGSPARSYPYERKLADMAGQGHELVLHGYTHSDDAPLRMSLLDCAARTLYSRREGEFAALDCREACERIEQGLAWFGERGWPVEGFVAPAWLMSKEARAALTKYPFEYTTSYTHFHGLRSGRVLFAPSLVYAARNGAGRLLSRPAAAMLARLMRDAPLVRLALHPADAHHPVLVRHAQDLIGTLLIERTALTKAAFARNIAAWPAAPITSTVPSNQPSGPGHIPPTSADDRAARPLPWR